MILGREQSRLADEAESASAAAARAAAVLQARTGAVRGLGCRAADSSSAHMWLPASSGRVSCARAAQGQELALF